MTTTQVFLGIGSNINRQKAINNALTALQKTFGEMVISPTFESEPVGFDGTNFYNLVVAFTTSHSLLQIVEIYKNIEDQGGRDRSAAKFSPRVIDIDLLLYGDLVCTEPVSIPREEILQNAFVLWPLSLIAPDLKHPQTGRCFAEHWQAYENTQKLWLVETDWSIQSAASLTSYVVN